MVNDMKACDLDRGLVVVAVEWEPYLEPGGIIQCWHSASPGFCVPVVTWPLYWPDFGEE